ncbi:DSBA-like thioredoxin domain-containing protein [Gracilibacillus ureilyticus]|uniref:DSBA-like thioredoxin domain-containing protein n=1 Tax=Gracilibacillus ureilyticus TaxID=531814 RepID=A0A1H9P374_9BACI|nr:DsbA family oxidoreductase [Gracilibacillus ureilyticus]SER42571.1 DSBA-like thioredoxin domain-containing protein [Gracilibacillus ureilyticus]
MKIEIWSDFVCPFCYIGKRRLEQAIERFPEEIEVELHYKSFQLDPNAPTYNGESIHAALAKKYNMSVERAKQMNQQVGDQAKSVGLEFVFDTMKPTNTFHTHRLSKFAKSAGKESEFVDEMLYQYFTLSADLSDRETLITICGKLGLDKEKVKQVLDDDKMFADEVYTDQDEAQKLGITGVPFFVFNGKYAISGAQPIETFMNALEKIVEDMREPLQDISHKKGSFCDGDNCN